jgi:phosphoribosylformylglycinamidine cyclo-ligase
MGLVKPKERLIWHDKIQHDDAIVIFESSGIHANGLTLAREIAAKLPEGYMTKLSDGRTYGETLLDPTHIYVPAIEDCLDNGVRIRYAVNITGHGWRKLMRAPQPFAYVIDKLPKPLPIFDFIQENGPVDNREAYGNLNMGAGFAIYVPIEDVPKVFDTILVHKHPFTAFLAGHVEKSDTKKVVIEPKKGLEFLGSTLAVR